MERCLDKPLAYTDGGPWYKWALELYGLRHRVEAWLRTLKARTRRFSNNLPYRRMFKPSTA